MFQFVRAGGEAVRAAACHTDCSYKIKKNRLKLSLAEIATLCGYTLLSNGLKILGLKGYASSLLFN